jgi:hypothetical protein
METVVSKLRGTRQLVAKQGGAFVTRARKAGHTFVEETAAAGGDLVGVARDEARRWRRFTLQRVAHAQTGILSVTRLPAIERRLLEQVDDALRAIDERIQARLATLTAEPNPKARPTAKPSKSTARKSKVAAPLAA